MSRGGPENAKAGRRAAPGGAAKKGRARTPVNLVLGARHGDEGCDDSDRTDGLDRGRDVAVEDVARCRDLRPAAGLGKDEREALVLDDAGRVVVL